MAKSTKTVLNTYKKQYQKSQKQWKKKTGFPTTKKKNFYDKYTTPAKPYKPKKAKPINVNAFTPSNKQPATKTNNDGCYIATCVYGSYDCPEVWTLRRFRDNILKKNRFGCLFIKCYYAISPTIVKLFGNKQGFIRFWKNKLDKIVVCLNNNGIENIKYQDNH